METKSQGGARFLVTFIDDFSRDVVIYFVTHKSEIVDQFKKYEAMMENQVDAKIKCIRTDNGGEYMNRRFLKMCQSSGIIHQTTVPYLPQQNGLAERMNQKIMQRARSLINFIQVEKKWWTEAVNIAVCITNSVPCAAHPNKTPYEICFKTKPNLEYLRVFGAHDLAHIDTSKRKKLDTKVFRCMYLGYSNQTKGLRVWNLELKRIEYTRSSHFQEHPPRKYVRVINGDATDHYIPHESVRDDEEGKTLVPVIPTQQCTPMDVDMNEQYPVNYYSRDLIPQVAMFKWNQL